jgi:hypothetical protein
VYGLENDTTQLFDITTIVLPLTQLRKRLEHLTVMDYYPVLEYNSEVNKPKLVHEESSLPITIKESNVEYQVISLGSLSIESFIYRQMLSTSNKFEWENHMCGYLSEQKHF